jgi:hypothetical protein
MIISFVIMRDFDFCCQCFQSNLNWGRRRDDHTVVGFTTTCGISAYHH